MKLRQRSQIAFTSSIAIHLILLLLLSVFGAFKVFDKNVKPVEIVFFDSLAAGGGSAGGGSMQQSTQQAAIPTPVVDTDSIQDTSNSTPYTPATNAPSAVTNNTEVVGNGSGSGSNSGSGNGTGNGTGSGDSTGSGTGTGPVSNPAVPPRVTRHVSPEYPSAARSAGITGVVSLQVLITSGGDVQNVEVYESSGNSALDSAAIRAVRNWQFTAAKDSAGRRVACYTVIPIRFNLKN